MENVMKLKLHHACKVDPVDAQRLATAMLSVVNKLDDRKEALSMLSRIKTAIPYLYHLRNFTLEELRHQDSHPRFAGYSASVSASGVAQEPRKRLLDRNPIDLYANGCTDSNWQPVMKATLKAFQLEFGLKREDSLKQRKLHT
jgi:hypothetical protein